jgi:SAM-dependent methyltransferase
MPLEFWTGVVGEPLQRESSTCVQLAALLAERGIRPGARIIDLASGTGVDSLYFAKNGFQVTCNEIDSSSREYAREIARKAGVSLDFTEGYDWRNLPGSLHGAFDAALCLGNSFTYLFDKDDRTLAARNFASVVRPGGVVIIDQRNYDYMLKDRETILQDPSRNFRWKGAYYYLGEEFRIFPTVIEDDFVSITCQEKKSGRTQHVDVYPIKRAELTDLMLSAGLRVTLYGDFHKIPLNTGMTDCDFYQQVGVKQ